ncbi:hypothetical protein [Brevundimonas diminuta]|uniref:hypothetical protein n=1 Tax=Brevundimonas diminuta TaxID=293 RepID=UPI0030FCC813
MARRLHYFARALVRVDGRLQGREPLHFLSAQDAEDGGMMLARLADGAVAYQQLGDPENDIWDDPELLAVYGEVTAAQVWAAAA